MNRVLLWAARILAVLGIAFGLAVFNHPEAFADRDPHMPDGGSLWCQGGLGNVAMIPYCNGLPYPDGSYWHQEAASPFGIGGPGLPWQPPVLIRP